jgi:hypothetical protein
MIFRNITTGCAGIGFVLYPLFFSLRDNKFKQKDWEYIEQQIEVTKELSKIQNIENKKNLDVQVKNINFNLIVSSFIAPIFLICIHYLFKYFYKKNKKKRNNNKKNV